MPPSNFARKPPHLLPTSSDKTAHLHPQPDAPPTAHQSGADPQTDVKALDRLALLKERFRHGVPTPDETPTDSHSEAGLLARLQKRTLVRRGTKSLIALGLVIALG